MKALKFEKTSQEKYQKQKICHIIYHGVWEKDRGIVETNNKRGEYKVKKAMYSEKRMKQKKQ